MPYFRCSNGNSKIHRVALGSAGSFDVSSYPGYKKFTSDNFIVAAYIPNQQKNYGGAYCADGDSCYIKTQYTAPAVSYNAAAGIVTVTAANYAIKQGRLTYDVGSITPSVSQSTYLIY